MVMLLKRPRYKSRANEFNADFPGTSFANMSSEDDEDEKTAPRILSKRAESKMEYPSDFLNLCVFGAFLCRCAEAKAEALIHHLTWMGKTTSVNSYVMTSINVLITCLILFSISQAGQPQALDDSTPKILRSGI